MPGVQSTERKEVLQQNGIESQPIIPFIEGQMLSSFHTTPIKLKEGFIRLLYDQVCSMVLNVVLLRSNIFIKCV